MKFNEVEMYEMLKEVLFEAFNSLGYDLRCYDWFGYSDEYTDKYIALEKLKQTVG